LVSRRAFLSFERFRRRQRRIRPIDAGVNPMALDRVARLRPFTLRPHEIGEARTIDELVDHSRRDQRRVVTCRRRGEMEFELVVGHLDCAANNPPPAWLSRPSRIGPLTATEKRKRAFAARWPPFGPAMTSSI